MSDSDDDPDLSAAIYNSLTQKPIKVPKESVRIVRRQGLAIDQEVSAARILCKRAANQQRPSPGTGTTSSSLIQTQNDDYDKALAIDKAADAERKARENALAETLMTVIPDVSALPVEETVKLCVRHSNGSRTIQSFRKDTDTSIVYIYVAQLNNKTSTQGDPLLPSEIVITVGGQELPRTGTLCDCGIKCNTVIHYNRKRF